MPWRQQVDQWRQAAVWEGQGAPPDLLLSIINNESGGFAGVAAKVKTKYSRALPLRAGGTKTVDRALGLMQCIPVVIEDYNKAHPSDPVYYDDMTGKTAAEGRLQIRVGAWLFGRLVRRLNQLYPGAFPAQNPAGAGPEQLTAALVAYARGLGALKEKFDQLQADGLTLTQRNLYERFPLWGFDKLKRRWINRPLYYAAKVWRNYQRNRTNDPGSGPPPNPAGQPAAEIARRPAKKTDLEYGVPLLLLAGAIVASKLFGKR